MTRTVAVALCALAAAARTFAADPSQMQSDYQAMQKWQFATPAASLSITQPVVIKRDTATWTLNSGSVSLMQPASGGKVTGFVWRGDGRFVMTVPDRYELIQLQRFAGRPMSQIDEAITDVVFRASDDTIAALFANAPKPVAFATSETAQKRHEHWLIDQFSDVDASVTSAIANKTSYWSVGFKTANLDWLTYEYDADSDEEISLFHFERGAVDTWLSLDRPEDRVASGRPGTRVSRRATLGHLDVKADLTRYGRTGRVGETEQRTINGHFVVEEELSATAQDVHVLRMEIAPTAQNVVARDIEGKPLVVIRDRIGERSASIENKVHDSTFALVLPAPLKAGDSAIVTFEYDLEIPNFAMGDTWYPTVSEAFDEYTAKLELTVNAKNQVRAMGRLAEEKTNDARGKTSIWLVERPTKMVTFSTAERFEEVPLEVKGIPTIQSFGWSTGLDVKSRVRNSGADVANSMQFFQVWLDSPIGGDKFYVTSIVGYHGQAFDGFLHLAESSYSEHPGASELFRAHETAHEWFGHRVGWLSYRDQWLSEALAEYAAMVFVKSVVKGGDKFFEEILQVYDYQIRGDLRGTFSKFNRPWLTQMSAASRYRIAPIGHGYRASSADVPAGYTVQTYIKGPLVLHMLRQLFLFRTHSDDLFTKILRDYVREFSGKQATTADFQKVIERNAPGDWSWFFNNWIYRAEIPTVRWSYRVDQAGDKYSLSLTVKKSDVPPEFVFMVPVTVEFEGGKEGTFIMMVKDAEQTITRDLPMRPRNVVFAPKHSLLANIKKE
jgi:hypothetical protein